MKGGIRIKKLRIVLLVSLLIVGEVICVLAVSGPALKSGDVSSGVSGYVHWVGGTTWEIVVYGYAYGYVQGVGYNVPLHFRAYVTAKVITPILTTI